MKIVNVVQGTPDWHKHRAKYRNASASPAVMSESSYVKREDYVKEIATGAAREVTEYDQARFNKGHRWEANARPVVEDLMGETLSPVTGVNGRYSASFDGITFMGNEWFEHKAMNQTLRDILSVPGVTGADLPLEYQIQMEHQAMVCDGERCLFAASSWDDEDNLIEFMYCWYTPNPELRQKIEAAWDQFERDVAAYKPEAEVVEAKADLVVGLPSLSIQTSGEIAVRSNLTLFGAKLKEFVDNLNLKPETDLDFANADEACKVLQKAQDALEAAEASALGQASSLDELRRTVASLRDTARSTRLMLEKLVDSRKKEIKLSVISKGKEDFLLYLAELEAGLSDNYVIRLQDNVAMPDFADAAKNKRTMSSLKSSISDALAAGKAAAHVVANGVSVRLKLMDQLLLSCPAGAAIVTADLQSIIFKSDEDFELQIRSRIERFERAAAAAEEAKKAEQEKAAATTATADDKNMVNWVPLKSLERPPSEPQPSDNQIVRVVAATFGVDARTAAGWILSMNRNGLQQFISDKPF